MSHSNTNNPKPGFWVGNVPKNITQETMLLYCPEATAVKGPYEGANHNAISFIILFDNEEDATLCCRQLSEFVLDDTVGKLETNMLKPQISRNETSPSKPRTIQQPQTYQPSYVSSNSPPKRTQQVIQPPVTSVFPSFVNNIPNTSVPQTQSFGKHFDAPQPNQYILPNSQYTPQPHYSQQYQQNTPIQPVSVFQRPNTTAPTASVFQTPNTAPSRPVSVFSTTNILPPKTSPRKNTTTTFTTKPSVPVTSTFSLPINLTEAKVCYLLVICKDRLNKLVTAINLTAKNRLVFTNLHLGSSKIFVNCDDIDPVTIFTKFVMKQFEGVEELEPIQVTESNKKKVMEIATKHECGAYYPKGDQKSKSYACVLIGKQPNVTQALEEVKELKTKIKMDVFVLDTNIYLRTEPNILRPFLTSHKHAIGIPYSVIKEFEGLKKGQNEAGARARQAMICLEDRQEKKLPTYTQRWDELPRSDTYAVKLQHDDYIILYAQLLAEKMQQQVHIITDDRAVRMKSNAYENQLIVYNSLESYLQK
jgi:hypothetical protein